MSVHESIYKHDFFGNFNNVQLLFANKSGVLLKESSVCIYLHATKLEIAIGIKKRNL